MGHLLHALHERQPLPDHAAALAHYSHQAALAAKLPAKIVHTYTLRPTVLPKARQIVSVSLEGATHTVALDQDEDCGPEFWIDAIKIGGKWHSAVDTFRDDFIRALEKQVREDYAYEVDAACGVAE